MRHLIYIVLLVAGIEVTAQEPPLTYYLPDIPYDLKIPAPEAFLGYQIGEWHLSHDLQNAYIRALAAASPRVRITEYARTYEQRPLVYLTITSEENHRKLEFLKEEHRKLSDPEQSAGVDIVNLPLVLYQGFSIHGNEPSGGNSAPLVAYYLAAGQSEEVERLLDEVIILLDPCFNPDGFNRFATWANMHRNKNLTADPQDREYNEVWPRGRTNHYWFDLNRDWLPVQHPESKGRVANFHDWKPNVLTDHHEMGTNFTFFFMPGEPERVHPLTPLKNQELTFKIGQYHAEVLDQIGSLYYSQEGYDDFYYGKGSTYPDVNGGIGILFEQASSRGHLQETDNGLMSFAFTIRNQVKTALSTQKASLELRREILEYQRDFWRTGLETARKDDRKAYVFADPADPGKVGHFIEILKRHQIGVHRLARPLTIGEQRFEPGQSYIIPLEQTQYRMIHAIFETMTEFKDSLFYDISTWTIPLAFNLSYGVVSGKGYTPQLLGEAVGGLRPERPAMEVAFSDYAYVLPWGDYYAPKAANALLKKGLRVKVSTEEFSAAGRKFYRGALLVPVQNQDLAPRPIHDALQEVVQTTGVPAYAVNTGFNAEGVDLGSRTFETLSLPEVLLIVGDGVQSNDAGEVWHLLDQRYDMVVSMAETGALSRMDLDRYTAIVMVDGSYNAISQGGADRLKGWVQNGGTLIAMKGAVEWLNGKGLAQVSIRTDKKEDPGPRPYGMLAKDRGALEIPGSIFEVRLDLTHPLAYGYQREKLPVFRDGTLFLEPSKNPYASPVRYTDAPLLSGFINYSNSKMIRNSAGVVVNGLGSGKVICMADNPNFRAFWFGTNKLFANAIFFGSLINNGTVERVSGRE